MREESAMREVGTHRWALGGVIVVLTALLAACGGDDGGGDDSADPSTLDGTSGDGIGDASSDAVDVDVATATVTVDGVTMRFARVEPGPDEDYYTFCTPISGTLQAVFPRVDESGNVLAGELSVILIEPGTFADELDEPPEFSVDNGERFWTYHDPDPFDIPASGRSASGTAILSESGAMDPTTGEIARTPFEASLQVSC